MKRITNNRLHSYIKHSDIQTCVWDKTKSAAHGPHLYIYNNNIARAIHYFFFEFFSGATVAQLHYSSVIMKCQNFVSVYLFTYHAFRTHITTYMYFFLFGLPPSLIHMIANSLYETKKLFILSSCIVFDLFF